MELSEYREQIKFLLTGGVLETELRDEDYNKIIEFALREVNRYYDSTQLVQTNATGCIDLEQLEKDNDIKINSISNIYRATATATGTTATQPSMDPMTVSQWQLMNGATYGLTEWTNRYATYTLTQQVMNTTTTDLAFKEDKLGRKLYVDLSQGSGSGLTIEYVPLLENVNQVKGHYWMDILLRLALAYTKITLGRIRTRYTQSNALWNQDGETILAEGNTELTALRERLQVQTNLSYPLD